MGRASPRMGSASSRLVFVRAPDAPALLWAMEEALKSGALAAVVGEMWSLKAYGLAASRRLLLAARSGRDAGAARSWRAPLAQAERFSSAAETRFEIAAASSGHARRRRPAGLPGAVRLRGAAGESAASAPRGPAGARLRCRARIIRLEWRSEERLLLVTRRFLSLWLARLPTDRARRAAGRDPARAARRHRQNQERAAARLRRPEAASLGLAPGLSLADARARHPNLIAVEAAPAEEARLLERLSDWCSRFTPLVALDGADGLMLDISGVAHLFGGEAAMAEDSETRLAAQGFDVALGVADNPRAAWALARFSPPQSPRSALRSRPSPSSSTTCRSPRSASTKRPSPIWPAPACGASAMSRCARARRSPRASAPT